MSAPEQAPPPVIEGWWNARGASFSAWQRRLERAGLTVVRVGRRVTITRPNVLELPSWIYRDAHTLRTYGVLDITFEFDARTLREIEYGRELARRVA